MNIKLRGGPLDGATLPAFGWVEAVVLRTETGLHWYLYTGPPLEADEGYDGTLEHHADETQERAVASFDGPALMEQGVDLRRRNIAYALAQLRRQMPSGTRKDDNPDAR
jgi:hypothetical protein